MEILSRKHSNTRAAWVRTLMATVNIYLLFSIFHHPLAIKHASAQEPQWQELKSEHFIVYFNEEEDFAKDVSRQSEDYYKSIASELGYQRHSGFWTWDNRVKLYLYPDRESFLRETNQPQWSDGVANYTDKSISSFVYSEGFLDGLLPHELAHLIFRDYVGFKGEVPLWLDEGVAQWMEPMKREAVLRTIKYLDQQGRLIPLSRMMSLDIRNSKDDDLVGVFYVQAVSLVSFLVTEYGTSRFTNFCRQLRDGKSIVNSLTFAYPTAIRSVEDLQEKWLSHIKEE